MRLETRDSPPQIREEERVVMRQRGGRVPESCQRDGWDLDLAMAQPREEERVGTGLTWLHQRLHGEYSWNIICVEIVMDCDGLYTAECV